MEDRLQKAILKLKETQDSYLKDELDEAIETVINRLEHLVKENKALQMTHEYDVKMIDKLKGEVVQLEKENEESEKLIKLLRANFKDALEDYVKRDYIPKSRIREEITKLEGYIKKWENDTEKPRKLCTKAISGLMWSIGTLEILLLEEE